MRTIPNSIRFKPHIGSAFWSRADCKPEAVKAVTPLVRFTLKGTDFELPLPGYHNLSNALAALCVCESQGCSLEANG